MNYVPILSALFLACSLTAVGANHVTYTADNVTIFRNPERGFTEELGGETKLSNSNNHVVVPEADEYFGSAARASQSLVVLMYYLANYRTSDLSNAILTGFDEDMQSLRDHGFKCVLRFAYNWTKKDDADTTQVKRHIAQLKPHLEANKDVIYVIETGWVGQWGEWYYTQNYTNKSQHLNKKRKAVLEAMLDACPADRFLLVRYPLIKIEYLGDENALTSAQAFTGTKRARIGHHNDAFLNDYGNDGTYSRDDDETENDPVLRAYIAQETLYVPNGGETNVEEDALASQVYSQAESEMATYHWSFCGSTYAEEVTNRWRTSGIYDNLERKLGYRYQLISADLPSSATAGSQARFQLSLKNVGFAPLYNERRAYIVLKNNAHTCALQLTSDPRRWLPNGVVTSIDEQLLIPTSTPNGTYQLYLYLPDIAPSLANDPRYAVRFANTGVWEESSGMNNLNASITIQGGAQGLENNEWQEPVQKIFRNNRVLILRGGKTYMVTGQEIR